VAAQTKNTCPRSGLVESRHHRVQQRGNRIDLRDAGRSGHSSPIKSKPSCADTKPDVTDSGIPNSTTSQFEDYRTPTNPATAKREAANSRDTH
jgi:hypothetical protein